MQMVTATNEYKEFQFKLNKIAKATPVSGATPEEISSLMISAKKIPSAYDPLKAKQKGISGAQTGTISAAVATVAYAILKEKLKPVLPLGSIPDETIILILSAAIGGAVHGLQTWFINWKNHKDHK